MPNDFHQGDHVCGLYETPGEQLIVAARYIAEGIRSRERSVYVGRTAEVLDLFLQALERAGIDTGAALAGGALRVKTNADAHLLDGHFDADRLIRQIETAAEKALADGFAGLRACGDMSWLLDDAAGASDVVEYEARLNDVFANLPAVAMCQYDRAWLPTQLLDGALETHRSVVVDGVHKSNPYYRRASATNRWPAHAADVNQKIADLRRRP